MKNHFSEKAKAKIDEVIRRLENGDIENDPIADALETLVLRYKNPNIPSSRWSYGNRFMTWLETGEIDCRTYYQWKEVGRRVVVKGIQGYILVPLQKKITKRNPRTEEEEEIVILRGFKAVPVFPLTATEGEPIPVAELDDVPLPPLQNVAEALGYEIEYTPIDGNFLGCTYPESGVIKLATRDPQTLFHELAHAIHHKITPEWNDLPQERKEIVAEFTASALAELYGFGNRTKSLWEYAKYYSDDPLRSIMAAFGDIEKVIDFIAEYEDDVVE